VLIKFSSDLLFLGLNPFHHPEPIYKPSRLKKISPVIPIHFLAYNCDGKILRYFSTPFPNQLSVTVFSY